MICNFYSSIVVIYFGIDATIFSLEKDNKTSFMFDFISLCIKQYTKFKLKEKESVI